jgi:hypothetical protein
MPMQLVLLLLQAYLQMFSVYLAVQSLLPVVLLTSMVDPILGVQVLVKLHLVFSLTMLLAMLLRINQELRQTVDLMFLHKVHSLTSGTSIQASYVPGAGLFPSLNGFLTTFQSEAGHDHASSMALEAATTTALLQSGLGAMAIVKIAPDSTSDELVYDQRI